MLPTTLWGKSPCEFSESVIGKPQNTSSWSSSEADCRDAVCVGVLRNSTVMPLESSRAFSVPIHFTGGTETRLARNLSCIVLVIDARVRPNTQVRAEHLGATTGHLFEVMMAICHQGAFRQLWKK